MPLIAWSEVAGIAVALFVAAIVLDMGGKYRIQLMYSATHKGSYKPRLKTKPSIRHGVLGIIVCISLYMYWNRIRNTGSFAFVALIAMFVVYGVILYLDSVRDLKEQKTD